jgi:SRSO17 transposase
MLFPSFSPSPEVLLDRFLHEIGPLFNRPERCVAFAMYARGVLGGGARKSVKSIAARAAAGDAVLGQRYHDRLCHFLNSSPWSDRALRARASHLALSSLPTEAPRAWVVGEVCFSKQGSHSPGVMRQRSRSAGKLLNCQLAVGLTLATGAHEVPLDIDLFLPEAWTADPARRKLAKVPELPFRSASEIALGLLREAALRGLPAAPVVADPSYGSDPSFRAGLTAAGLPYVLEIRGDVSARAAGAADAPVTSLREIARALPEGAFQPVPGGDPEAAGTLYARVRLELVRRAGGEPQEHDLLIERCDGRAEPLHYALSSLPAETPLADLALAFRARSAPRAFDELKNRLGLDHFEGRTYIGWQHHASVVFACNALRLSARSLAQAAPVLEPACEMPVESAA